jgi:dihydroneopterin aldolase
LPYINVNIACSCKCKKNSYAYLLPLKVYFCTSISNQIKIGPMTQLVLENMEFYAFHGHYPEEQTIGGRYMVDLTLETDTDQAESTDDLVHTVDYSRIYEIVKQEMTKPAKIMEHLARRILDAVRNNVRGIENITVKVSKMNPPVGGQMGSFKVILKG